MKLLSITYPSSLPHAKSLDLIGIEVIVYDGLKIGPMIEIWIQKGNKHHGEKRKMFVGNQYFLSFSSCLSKALSFKVIHIQHIVLTHSHTITPFDTPGKQAFWKQSGKRRNCS